MLHLNYNRIIRQVTNNAQLNHHTSSTTRNSLLKDDKLNHVENHALTAGYAQHLHGSQLCLNEKATLSIIIFYFPQNNFHLIE